MNVSEEVGKNSELSDLSSTDWKKSFFMIYSSYTVVLYKTLIEKYFCSVQQLQKFE